MNQDTDFADENIPSKQYDEEGRVIRANRTQLKRERAHIKELAQELLKLPARQYALLPINETLQNALTEGKRLEGNALKRHLGFLTRLIDEQGEAEIRAAHERVNHPFLRSADKTRRIQHEIKRLWNQDEGILQELMERYEDFNIQYVRQLLRQGLKWEKEKKQSASDKPQSNKYQQQLQSYLAQLALKS